MDFITSDEDTESGEEATPTPEKKALKSGKIRTADSSVLHKAIWPYEVVYTATGKPAEYDDKDLSSHSSSGATWWSWQLKNHPSVCS